MNNPVLTAPIEPLLPMDDIQGMAVPGFLKPYHTLVGLTAGADQASCTKLASFIASLTPRVTSGRDLILDRDTFRAERLVRSDPRNRHLVGDGESEPVFLGIGFTYRGLIKLTPGAESFTSEAFRAGMSARSALLGDPTDATKDGAPAKWVVGAAGNELDVLLVLVGDHREPVTLRAQEIIKKAGDAGIGVTYTEDGSIKQEPGEHGVEHFGFKDGVSQPGIRGLIAIDGKRRPITPRTIDPGQLPETWLYGRPGQHLLWPGEFILGQPTTGPDPLLPGPARCAGPAWTRNGSFLVFRRLNQDVGLFWRTMQMMAAELTKAGWATEAPQLAARFVGRWPSGAPLSRVPNADNLALGRSPLSNNNFLFDSDTPALQVHTDAGHPYTDSFPIAKADPVGLRCPAVAHIRKVNARDSATDMGGGDAAYTRRILRIGIPFGTFVEPKDRYTDVGTERGLLFMSIQASIENQFEFLQRAWINDDTRPRMPSGNDMIAGQNQPAPGSIRRCTLIGPGPDFRLHALSTDKQWVFASGGEYCFVPSLSALREVIGAYVKG